MGFRWMAQCCFILTLRPLLLVSATGIRAWAAIPRRGFSPLSEKGFGSPRCAFVRVTIFLARLVPAKHAVATNLPVFSAAAAAKGPRVAPRLSFRIAAVTGLSNSHGTTGSQDGAIHFSRA